MFITGAVQADDDVGNAVPKVLIYIGNYAPVEKGIIIKKYMHLFH